MPHLPPLNIISITASVQVADFAFYTTKQEGYCFLHKDALENQIIDRLYLFGRLYWKNVSQQNLPVTIKLHEMVAEITHNFKYDKLANHYRGSLWFL